jgi:hypothetical protein
VTPLGCGARPCRVGRDTESAPRTPGSYGKQDGRFGAQVAPHVLLHPLHVDVDGFIAGPADDVSNGLGNGGQRLHKWLSDGRGGIGPSGVNGEVYAQLMSTGAVVVDDVADAMARAKASAGDRDVLVHGARTAQLALGAGVLDELEVHQVPVLLGDGRLLFDGLGPEHIELELARVIDASGVTHLRYRVRRS